VVFFFFFTQEEWFGFLKDFFPFVMFRIPSWYVLYPKDQGMELLSLAASVVDGEKLSFLQTAVFPLQVRKFCQTFNLL